MSRKAKGNDGKAQQTKQERNLYRSSAHIPGSVEIIKSEPSDKSGDKSKGDGGKDGKAKGRKKKVQGAGSG